MIKGLWLKGFRNFSEKKIKFSAGTTIIVDPNATGKTNILEAISLLATGKSFRAKIEEEMVNYNTDIARVNGFFGDGGDKNNKDSFAEKLEVVLTRGEIEVGENRYEKAPRKKLLVNGIARRLIDFAGNFRVVVFGPWDLELVTESPSVRRNFLDTVLIQVDREYRRAILSYEKGLRQRNRLLLRIREEGLSRSQLLFWDKLLVKNGNFVTEKRGDFINYLNSRKSINKQEFKLLYDKSVISPGRLNEYAAEEVAAATTLVGPHRDDFVFQEKGAGDNFRDLSSFGSRGEQRMGVLWLKMGELSFVGEKIEGKPTLLLDDIFSELDREHRKVVMQLTKTQQTIITTTDLRKTRDQKGVEIIRIG